MFLNFGKFRLKMSKNPTSTTDDSINYQSTSQYLQERGKNPHIPHIHKQIGLGAFWISIKKDHLQSPIVYHHSDTMFSKAQEVPKQL